MPTHGNSSLFPYVALVVLVVPWCFQMMRWGRVADHEDGSRRVLAVARAWAFPPAPSATALKHQKSLVNLLLGSVLTFLTALFSGAFGAYYGDRSGWRLTPPPSLAVLGGILAVLTVATGAQPVLFILAVGYGLIFPWGMPARGQRIGARGRRSVIFATILALLCIILAKIAVFSLITTGSLLIFLAPVLVAMCSPGQNAETTVSRPVAAGPAPNGAWVVDATSLNDGAIALETIKDFVNHPCLGTRYLVTAGIPNDPKASYAVANEAFSKNVTVVAVGRLNATPLREGSRGAAKRVDTLKQAISWINERLTRDDAVLYLGDHPPYLP